MRRRGLNRLRIGIAVAVALLAAACQTTSTTRPRAAGQKEAFFWEAVGPNGSKLFLLGSVHIGDGRELALDPRIEEDWKSAQELVVELDLSAPSPIDTVEATNRHGLLPEPKTLQQVVRADTYAQVKQYMKTRDYSMDRVDQMRPWMVALVVQDLEYGAAGLQTENGVDAVLLRRARGQKPIVALESLDEQMSAFAGLPDSLQEAWLSDMLHESPSLLLYTREMLQVWEAGDDARMMQMLFSPDERQPEQAQFYERMYWSRNRLMTDRLTALAADGKPRFVVLGTGHMLGPQGVPELLAQRGYTVRRLGSAKVVGATPPAAAPTTTAAIPAPAPAPAPALAPPTPTATPQSATAPSSAPAFLPVALPGEPVFAPGVPIALPAAPALVPASLAAPADAAPPVAPAVAPAPRSPSAPSVHDDWLKQDAQGSTVAPAAEAAPAAAPPPKAQKPATKAPAKARSAAPAKKKAPAAQAKPAAAKSKATAKPAAKKPAAKAKPVAKPAAKATAQKPAAKAKPAPTKKPAAKSTTPAKKPAAPATPKR